MKHSTLFLEVIALLLTLCLAGCGAKADDAAMMVPTEDVEEIQIEETPADANTADSSHEPEQENKLESEAAPEKERTTLVMVGLDCADSKMKMVINEFNNTNKDYKIVFMDYAYGISAEQGETKLLTKILSDSPPDMLLFENLSPLPYMTRGLLLDLDPLVEEDPNLEQNDFIIWDALHEYGGMYLLGPKFTIESVYCTQETAAVYAGWTLEDYIELQNALDDEQDLIYYITPEYFFIRIGTRYLHRDINFEDATCDFENPEFISMLEAAYNIKEYDVTVKHTQADGSFKSVPAMMMDGELLFCGITIRSAADVAFDRFRSGGTRMAYIGWPTPDGSSGQDSGSDVTLYTPVGICAGSDQAEGCWEFIKFMLQNPIYQDYFDGTPVLESLLAANLESIIADSIDIKWETGQQDQDLLVALAKTCKTMSFYDEDILQMILEEGEAMLERNAAAQEVAALIQNRASLLISERYG